LPRLRRAAGPGLPARAGRPRPPLAPPRGPRGPRGGGPARGGRRFRPGRAGGGGAPPPRAGRPPRPRGPAPHVPDRRDGGACGTGRPRRMTSPVEASQALRVSPPRRVLLVAGEASGDLHGADLLTALRARLPDVEVFGLGGERLRAAGMHTVADAGEVATVGVLEGVGRLRTIVRVFRALARRLREGRADLCVLIDFPEFNLRLARVAKRAGVPG